MPEQRRPLAYLDDRPNWDETWFGVLYLLSRRSHDPRTAVACVVVDKEQRYIASGYNGVPRGVAPEEKMFEGEAKYDWMVHAEENAIADAARRGVSIKGATMYVPFYPCIRCARQAIQAGIARVVVHKEGHDLYFGSTPDSKWSSGWLIIQQMFKEAAGWKSDAPAPQGLYPRLEVMSVPDVPGPVVRLAGKSLASETAGLNIGEEKREERRTPTPPVPEPAAQAVLGQVEADLEEAERWHARYFAPFDSESKKVQPVDRPALPHTNYPIEDLVRWCEGHAINMLVRHQHGKGTPLHDIARLLVSLTGIVTDEEDAAWAQKALDAKRKGMVGAAEGGRFTQELLGSWSDKERDQETKELEQETKELEQETKELGSEEKQDKC